MNDTSLEPGSELRDGAPDGLAADRRDLSAAEPDRRLPGRKERTRLRLLEEAGKLFEAQGVESTTIEQVAEAAKVSVGTVYAHFGSKEALALVLIEQAMDVMEEYLAEARASGTSLEKVLKAGDAYFRFALDQPVVTRFGTIRGMQTSPGPIDALGKAFQHRIQRILLTIAGDLKQAMDDGEIVRRPIDETMVFVWGAWHGVTGLVIRKDAMAVPREVAERALAMGKAALISGLTAGLPEPGSAAED